MISIVFSSRRKSETFSHALVRQPRPLRGFSGGRRGRDSQVGTSSTEAVASHRRTWLPTFVAFIAGLAVMHDGSIAFAQPSTAGTRRLLIDQAQEARTGGDHVRALDLARRAARLEMTASLRWFIAEEELANNLAAEAFSSAVLCGREAGHEAASSSREGLVQRCRATADRARAAIGMLTIELPPGVEGTVQLDGAPMPIELVGVPQPQNPGEHTVVFTVAGRAPTQTRATVIRGQTSVVNVELPTAPVGTTNAAQLVQQGTTSASNQSPNGTQSNGTVASGTGSENGSSGRDLILRPPPPAQPTPSRAGPIGLMAAGGVGVALGIVFVALQETSLNGCIVEDRNSGDRVAVCPTLAQTQAASMYSTWTTASVVSFALGGASLAAGAVWWIASGSRGAPRVTAAVVPAADGAGLVIGGTL